MFSKIENIIAVPVNATILDEAEKFAIAVGDGVIILEFDSFNEHQDSCNISPEFRQVLDEVEKKGKIHYLHLF